MAVQDASQVLADLSYRSYDGPINGPGQGWLVIARTMVLKALRMRSVWTFAVLSGWYYVVMVVVLFFIQQFGSSNPAGPQAFQAFVNRLVWKDQFLHGFSFSQHLILVVTLLVGAGTIANDNRSNALLVYLSKPCRKVDYLFGKWLGVFVPIWIVLAIPTSVFYLYGIFSFRDQGFFSADTWLILRVMALLPLGAAIHASLIVAVSSVFRQGAIAGGVYAGVYFMGYFFTLLMKVIWSIPGGQPTPLVGNLNYCSIDGLLIGLAKAILKSGDTKPFGMPASDIPGVPAPALLPFLAIVSAIVGGSLWFAWTRIRAVEVV